MVEIAVAVSMANAAFRGIKNAVAAGKEIEDCASYFGKFFDAKESINEVEKLNQNAPLAKKVFDGQSIESQALEITAAKHKTQQLEKELREFLIYTGQGDFYNYMMRERRRIKQERAQAARERAINRKFFIDCVTIGVIVAIVVGIVSALIIVLA